MDSAGTIHVAPTYTSLISTKQVVPTARFKARRWFLRTPECIVFNSSQTSLVGRYVRDELRLLRPGLYLGRAHWHGLRVADFSLEA